MAVVNPDPLLEEELHAPPAAVIDDVPEGVTRAGAAPRRPLAQVLDIKEVNTQVDAAIKTFQLDGAKLAADATMMTVGHVPGVGDTIANVYQVANTLSGFGGTVKDFWNYGFTRVGFLKATTVAVGVAQIFTEPIPGLDAMTDTVAMHLDQAAYNADIRRGLERIRPLLRSPTSEFLPRLLFLPEGSFQYPDGMSKVTDGGDEGNPLGTLAFGTLFQSPAAMGRPIPFIVAGQVRLPDDSEPVAEKLGAVKTVTGWWIPLDLTPMLDAPVSRGDAVMQNFRVDHSVTGAPPMVVWDATCVRGKQYLRVRLKNGEISNDVFVNNVYMNAVSELEVTSVPNGELKMKVGEIKDGIQVFGKTDQANVRPELTRQDQCLAIDSSQEGVLSLRRSETIALRADKAGSTKVTFSLRDASPAVAKVVPVTVEDKDSQFLGWLKNTKTFTAVAEGDMTCKYTDDGSTSRCGFRFDNTVYNAGLVPVVWAGETFTIQGSIDSPVSGKCDLDASGRFNPATKSISGRFKTSCKFTQGTTQRTSLMEFSLGELPPLLGMVPEQEGKSYVFTLNSNHGHSASLIKSSVELINYTETNTSGGPVRTKKLDSVNWSGQINLQIGLMRP